MGTIRQGRGGDGVVAAGSDTAADREQRLREFCLRFAERAFRRPLTEEQTTLLVHFDKDHTEQFKLFRIEQPADGGAATKD